jgi:predicted nuclease of predicted toxin-antitoxin system
MIWVDAQLSPAIARWLRDTLGLDASALREIGLRDADDEEIFAAARNDNAIVMTKDADFILLLERLGPPPKIILLTCGNTSNAHLKTILRSTLTDAMELLNSGDDIVEIQ